MTKKLSLLVVFAAAILCLPASANDKNSTSSNQSKTQDWGIGALFRMSTIPYSTDFGVEDSTVTTFFPMMFYNGDRLFLRGTEGGFHLFQPEDTEFNALIRTHFIDIPSSLQNSIGGDTADFGLQMRHYWKENLYTELDLLSDPDGRMHGVASIGSHIETGRWLLRPKASLMWRDADYNSYYYGQDTLNLGGGVDAKVGMAARYHVYKNLYLMGGAYATYLNGEARSASTIDTNWQSELYLGFGFFEAPDSPPGRDIDVAPYIRVAHGWATPSNIGEIISGDWEKDEFNNQLTSVFYGLPLTDNLFDFPLDIYLHTGYVHHWSSEVQTTSHEVVASIKAYYTFPLPWRVRFGVAEGVSYINRLSYIEATEMEEKGYVGSKWLNYLDFTFDINLGDIFNSKKLKGTWLGYSIHHRSAIFESASQFGRIKGGSNYNTVYLQMEF